MANLVLIGNGFDLAHGLKTSYNDFINYFLNSCQNGYSSELLDLEGKEGYCKDDIIKEILGIDSYFFCAWLLEEIIKDYHNKQWCDVEYKYYQFISSLDELIEELPFKKRNQRKDYDIKKLNNDFGILKRELRQYLCSLESPRRIDLFDEIFNSFRRESQETMFLNFNYTYTLEYCYNIKRTVHLHGELKKEDNPIIFGIAGDQKIIQTLLDKNDNEYLLNVKRYRYKQTLNEQKLLDFLNKPGYKNIYVIGLSCGISDKFILNKIFTHPNVQKINLFYYKDKSYYDDLQMNIDRIIDAGNVFDKITNFQSSYRIPQFDDNKTTLEENKKILRPLLNKTSSGRLSAPKVPQRERPY